MKKGKRLLVSLLLALMLVVGMAVPALAAPSDDIVVTATPSFIGISIAPDAWNPAGSTAKILINTTYYANPLGATTAPSATVLDTECTFTITNTSTVITNLTGNFPDFASGDAMTNINTGYTTNGANAFGASSYVSGALLSAAVIIKSSASSVMITGLAATTDKKFGIAMKTKSGDFSSGTAMTSTITVTAVAQ